MQAPRGVAARGKDRGLCGMINVVRISQLCRHGGVVGHGHQLWVVNWHRLHPQWRLRWQRLHRWLLLLLRLVLVHEVIRGSVLLIRKMIKGEKSDGRNGTAAATAEALNLHPLCVGEVRLHLAQRLEGRYG